MLLTYLLTNSNNDVFGIIAFFKDLIRGSLGILGTSFIAKSQRLSSAARAASVKSLGASLLSASNLLGMKFYTTPCFSSQSIGSGNVGEITIHYKQVYSGDWEPRFGADCSSNGSVPLDSIPEIIEALNIGEQKLNNYWMLHNRAGQFPRADSLWIAPYPPNEKKGVRIVAHDNPANLTQVSELSSLNCYVKYSTPRNSFVKPTVETVTSGC